LIRASVASPLPKILAANVNVFAPATTKRFSYGGESFTVTAARALVAKFAKITSSWSVPCVAAFHGSREEVRFALFRRGGSG
jgi:hypothetical protein